MREKQYILFDLDGTLTDSGSGIIQSILYALGQMGKPTPSMETLRAFVGPPLLDSFMEFCHMSEEEAKEAVSHYRTYYKDKGIFDNRLYDGIEQTLSRLQQAGKTLILATSKPEFFAKKILEYFHIDSYFTYIAGADMEGKREEKIQVMKYALSLANITNLDETIMIGDRKFDVESAKQLGMESIGVLYGFGSEEELETYGATYLAETTGDIATLLIGTGQRAVELTKKLVSIDSSNPGNYEYEIGQWITEYIKKTGATITREEVLPNRFNVMAEIKGDPSLPALVFICHMDTVTLGTDWTKAPLGGVEIDGKIYGRGACDMKSGLACGISAFCELAQLGKKVKHSLKLICTVDEEDFMRGVEKAIASNWVTKEDWVLDTEPTNGQIQVAHKGRTWFEIEIKGITAHASMPWKGADANAAMAEVIREIRLAIERTPEHEDLGKSTVTFGQIEGGYRPYVVPDRCKVWVDMRLVPPTDTKKAEEIVKDAIQKAEKEIVGVTGSYVITGDRPYVEKDPNSYLLHCLKEVADRVTKKDTVVQYFPGYTDTAVIASTLGNQNCMSYGPGNLEQAHKPDEWVQIDDIVRCETVLIELAKRMLCLE